VNWGDNVASAGFVSSWVCTATHTYASPGAFTATMTVTDDDGGPGTASAAITISPQALQNGLVGFLDDLAPSGDRGTDGRVNNAIKDLEQGLTKKLWLDETHLSKFGAQVFVEHKQAVEDLLKIKSPPEFVTAATDTIASIVATDRMLAATLIVDNAAGKAGEIAKANEELAKGDDDAAAGNFASAIEHYRKAWEHAYRAGA
jgi:PKD repeat protein